MSSSGLLFFLLLSLPLVFFCAWSDLKSMRIPNQANVILFIIFVIFGWLFMPLSDFGFRLLYAGVVLIIFFILNILGLIGGGDAKLIVAITPYIAGSDFFLYLSILAYLSLGAIISHRLILYIAPLRALMPDWISFDKRKHFPFGLPLGFSLSAYLLYKIMAH